jgi:hypothetical protein
MFPLDATDRAAGYSNTMGFAEKDQRHLLARRARFNSANTWIPAGT